MGTTPGSSAASQALSSANVDAATGVFHDAVAFLLPAARGAVQPQLQLAYSSAGAYGVGGRGWSLALPSIERHNPSGPPQFNDPAAGQAANPLTQDRFTFGGSPLVEICFVESGGTCASAPNATGLLTGEALPSFVSGGGWHYYRLATESGSMARFFWSPDHTRWVVQYASGSTEEYGVPAGSADTSATDVDAQSHIFRWNRIRAYDAQRTASGTPANLIVYSWTQKKALRWGGNSIGYLSDVYDTPRPGDTAPAPASFAHHAHLVYGWPTTMYPSTTAPVWLQQPTNLLTGVDVTSQDFAATGQRQQVRRYFLSYTQPAGAPAAPDALQSVTLQGNCPPAQNNFEDPTTFLLPEAASTCPQNRPPMTFGYTSAAIAPEMVSMPSLVGLGTPPVLFDVNADGLPDVLDVNATYGGTAGTGTVYVNSATQANTFVPALASVTPPNGWGPTTVSQFGPGPSVLSGSFQMGGELSFMWSSVGEWTPAFVNGSGTWPYQPPGKCPTTAAYSWCDPTQNYLLYSAAPTSGGWLFSPGARGTFPLGTEFASVYQDLPDGTSCITNPCALGGEFPVGAIDMNADGVPDLVSTLYFADFSQTATWFSHRFSIRFTNRGYDGVYDDFAGSATPGVTENPMASSRTDVCLGGVQQSLQSANSGADPSPHYKLADVDGDGITDIVIYGDNVNNRMTYWPGHGDGVFGVCPDGSGEECPCSQATPETILPSVSATNSLVLGIHDVTGDGLADVVVAAAGGFTLYINEGGETPAFDGGHFIPAEAGLGSAFAAPTAFYFADMNGSGVDDVIVEGATPGIPTNAALGFVDLYSGGGNPPQSRPELLESISDGLGGSVRVAYTAVAAASRAATAAGTPWTTASPQSLHAVSSVTTGDVNGDAYTTTYAYANPVFDGRDNQFLGFESVSQTSPGAASAQTVTDTNYFYAACGVHHVPCEEFNDYPLASYRGLPILQDVHDGVSITEGTSSSPTYVSTTHHSYAADVLYEGPDQRFVRRIYERQTDIYLYNTAVFRPSPSLVKIDDTDLGEIPAVPFVLHGEAEHIEHQSSVDSFGNLSEMDDDGDVSASPADAVIKHLTTWGVPAATDPANAWIWRPLSTQVGGTAADLQNHTTTYAYDAHGNTVDATKTLVGTASLARAAGGAPAPAGASVNGTVHAGHYTYDANGNVLTAESYPSSTAGSAASRCVEVAYDAAYDQLPTTQTVDIGGCKSPTAMVTQVAYDRVLGLPTSNVDPAGARSATTYDGFGRVASIAKPNATVAGLTDPATTTVSYAVTAYGQLVHVNQAAGATYAASDAYVYEDGLGRTMQTVSTGDTAGEWVLSGQVVRDSRGRVTGRGLPTFVAAPDGSEVPFTPPASVTGTTYDAFNRVVKTTDIDGTVTSTRLYRALSFDSYDAETSNPASPHAGAVVTTSSDGHGRVSSVAKAGNGGTITTTYTYQPTGEVLSIGRGGTDQNGTVSYVRSMEYDSLGRLVVNQEPNTGYAERGTLPVGGQATSHWWRYAYDDVGELVGTSDARGCGENFTYDAAGRVASEDYSPCSTLQSAYTAPSTDGDGTEAYYVYEASQGPLVSGRLADVYDRASHVHYAYDARGRTTATQKQVAVPGVPAAALASRYAAAEYTVPVGYDDRDRVVSQGTGATVEALESTNATYVSTYGPSGLGVTYSHRGVPTSVGSSYGPLVKSAVVEADGRPDSVTYGDVAATVARFQFDARRRLAEVVIGHTAPYPAATATYTPPLAGSPQPTTPTYLVYDNVLAYDGVSNPLTVADGRLANEWPAGAKPETTRSYTYDDSYRLTNASVTFGESGTDTFAPPLAASSTSVSPMPLAIPEGTAGRSLTQTFAYDGLGNTVASSDDAELFFDRSLGTITNGTQVGALVYGPNQLTTAALTSTNGDGNASLTATYDVSGNVVQLAVRRNAGCTSTNGCHELFQYDWDELGRLARARRFDFIGGTTCSGLTCFVNPEPSEYAYPNLPTGPAAADVTYAYDAGGSRVLRASVHEVTASLPGLPPGGPLPALVSIIPQPTKTTDVTTYTVDVFPSLRLQGTTWSGSAYAETATTEEVYLTLGGTSYGRVVSNAALPAIHGPLHVFLELTDTLGSTAAVIDKDTSELVERTTYSPYGGVESDYRPDRWQDFREPFKFTGKEDDVEVGLTYFGARYLSTQLGRWVSPDPLTVHGVSGDLNPYAYVRGRVTTLKDATGLDDDEGSSSGAVRNTVTLPPDYIVGYQPRPAPPPPAPPPAPPPSPDPEGERAAANWKAAQAGFWNEAVEQVKNAVIAGAVLAALPSPANWPSAARLANLAARAAESASDPVPTDPVLRDNYDSARRLVQVVTTTVGVVLGGAAAAEGAAAEALPELEISASKYPELAENIQNALGAGRSDVLTHGGDAVANRVAALQDVPNIPGLSRDEFPFASSMEGGEGAWVGHIPAAQQSAQGGLISNFLRANGIVPGMQYRVVIGP
jgi:RHS repeat-associated protein